MLSCFQVKTGLGALCVNGPDEANNGGGDGGGGGGGGGEEGGGGGGSGEAAAAVVEVEVPEQVASPSTLACPCCYKSAHADASCWFALPFVLQCAGMHKSWV